MIKINNGFDTFLDSTGKLLETVPKFYDDVVQPTAIETGKTLSLLPKTINAALVPLRQWISHKEFNFIQTERLLAIKLEDVSPDKIVPPEPYVAVPAFQAISYSMNNNELRNLYANLLAKSMNTDTKDNVHPAFVEIIKQLSPFDAILLNKLTDTKETSFAISKIRIEKSESNDEGVDWLNHIIDPIFGVTIVNQKQYALSLENLQRLQLITIDYNRFLSDANEYSRIESSEIVTYCRSNSSSLHSLYSFLRCKKGILKITTLGKEFNDICISK